MRRRSRAPELALVGLITLGAAVLRLLYISRVSPDPFYDAAVRSMTLSWHNFFFGAFEPSGSVSIDKPPVDLWLQVISVKLLGFSSTTLKLPEILGGTLSVPLIYAAVRRMWSAPAGIAAAVAMAVLPVEVITARSDTMDAVMMALIVLALLFFVRAIESDRTVWLLAGAAMLGLAFNVKLLESIVALPGLAVLAYLGLSGGHLRRLGRMALAALVFVVVALSWLTATLIAPAHDRPYAIGSSNGSAWNAAFVFNGTERLAGKSPEPSSALYEPSRHYPTATQSERDRVPILPPSPTRLLARIGPLSGERLGMELLLALLLGIPALLWGLRSENDPRAPAPAAPAGPTGSTPETRTNTVQATVASDEQPPVASEAAAEPRALPAGLRMRRAVAAGLTLWMLTGIVLFSHMARLHPRYVEGFTPVVAAMLGIGAAWATQRRGPARLAVLAVALLASVYYAERLMFATSATWWVTALAAILAFVLALLSRTSALRSARLGSLSGSAVLGFLLVAALAVSLGADVVAIETHVTDAGYVGALPREEQRLVSGYVRAHQGSARYELAAESATAIGSLIVQDARPVLVLSTYNGRVFTSVPRLERLIAEGQVRYAFLNTFCTHQAPSTNPACSAPARWIRAHGRDVSFRAGLSHGGILYRLPGAAS